MTRENKYRLTINLDPEGDGYEVHLVMGNLRDEQQARAFCDMLREWLIAEFPFPDKPPEVN